MALASMTGFARVESSYEETRWVWELRSVNGKGMDARLRLPQGLDGVEAEVRKRLAAKLKRGNVSVGLQMQRSQSDTALVVNEDALEQVLKAISILRDRLPDAPEPTLDGILGYKGVLEFEEAEESEDEKNAQIAALLSSFGEALNELVEMRRSEGNAIATLLKGQVDTIEALARQAEELPSRSPEAIRARLETQVNELLQASSQLDPQRLHQEAAVLATKADIREELDRLYAHVEAVGDLLVKGGAIGRRLDFLAQEFNREANTLCSKSNSVELTAIGLELKTVIDQLREQTQNIE
ncbi:YicC/YloC family endoribonuclease [Pseudovibrio sp. POLY-S9]|uniref:YicC/YloC family endoribonuclease n=1 Tax=Pseudovibrio sp. POLY-S9 TaxID=1576596 RepID=UPI00070B224D|nr:YicC/YloC family endoribonuclease [Pseudovibrio sp. POLY-S9]